MSGFFWRDSHGINSQKPTTSPGLNFCLTILLLSAQRLQSTDALTKTKKGKRRGGGKGRKKKEKTRKTPLEIPGCVEASLLHARVFIYDKGYVHRRVQRDYENKRDCPLACALFRARRSSISFNALNMPNCRRQNSPSGYACPLLGTLTISHWFYFFQLQLYLSHLKKYIYFGIFIRKKKQRKKHDRMAKTTQLKRTNFIISKLEVVRSYEANKFKYLIKHDVSL